MAWGVRGLGFRALVKLIVPFEGPLYNTGADIQGAQNST